MGGSSAGEWSGLREARLELRDWDSRELDARLDPCERWESRCERGRGESLEAVLKLCGETDGTSKTDDALDEPDG